MSETFPGAGDVEFFPLQSQHIPIEVCETIIDTLYSFAIKQATTNIAALHSCSLVCRAWRIRAQRMLFYSVLLSDGTSLHSFSAALDSAAHLRNYVHEVTLTGYYLQTTTSILTLFPALLAGRLPNLHRISVFHLPETATWFPRPVPSHSSSRKWKPLSFIPLHPCFPHLLSSFFGVSNLDLYYTTFRSFREFARMLQALPALEVLRCNSVRWIYRRAKYTAQPGWVAEVHAPPPFGPKLQKLYVCVRLLHNYSIVTWFSSSETWPCTERNG